MGPMATTEILAAVVVQEPLPFYVVVQEPHPSIVVVVCPSVSPSSSIVVILVRPSVRPPRLLSSLLQGPLSCYTQSCYTHGKETERERSSECGRRSSKEVNETL